LKEKKKEKKEMKEIKHHTIQMHREERERARESGE
jgi:hypothetical protein